MPRRPVDHPLPDLTGTRALVTGASDGMGVRIAARLAAAGAELILPVRDRAKGEVAAAAIRERSPRAVVALHALDLASLASVAALGESLRAEAAPIHLLINNAGVMAPPQRRSSADGYELQFATNHLGHVALIGELMPLLRAGRARVTSQISIAAMRGGLHWDDLQWERSYDPMAAYRQSKIALGLFGLELGRRSAAEGWGITSNLSHPGIAPTSLLAARPEIGRRADTGGVRLIRLLSRMGVAGTPDSAALPALLASTAPASGDGLLYGPRGFGSMGGAPGEQALYRPLRDEAEARRVWDVSERLAGVSFAAR